MWLHRPAVPRRVRGRHRPRRHGRDCRDHRCLRRADDRQGRQDLRDQPRRRRLRERPVRPVDAGQFTHQAECGPSGWYGEETLDVEAVHAHGAGARTSTTTARPAASTATSSTRSARVVDDNQASLVTNSWGDLEANESRRQRRRVRAGLPAGCDAGHQLHLLLRRQRRRARQHRPQAGRLPGLGPVRHRASVAPSTAIGADGTLSFQTGWGTQKYSLSADGTSWTPVGFLYGAGGGYSALFNRPDYQNGVVPASAPRRTGGAGHRHGRRPDDRHAGRRDADVPGRRSLRRVPHRRHQPRLAAVRRDDGTDSAESPAAALACSTRRSTLKPVRVRSPT